MDKLPVVPKELIEYLDKICPDSSPRLVDGEREIWFKAGKVNLVRHLKSIFEEQNETILKGN